MKAPRLVAMSCCLLALVACAGTTVGAQVGVQPSSAAPGALPPPPPGSSLPDGQWVYTQQYGWIWMPYDDQFTYVPPGGSGEPLEFVFHGSYGWTWVAAPWVWGYGPVPHWGRPGPNRFAWYGHGWWRTPQRWSYVPPPQRGPVARPGVRPPPPGVRSPPQQARRPPPTAPRPPERSPAGQPPPARQGAAAGGEGGFTPSGAQR